MLCGQIRIPSNPPALDADNASVNGTSRVSPDPIYIYIISLRQRELLGTSMDVVFDKNVSGNCNFRGMSPWGICHGINKNWISPLSGDNREFS